MGKTGKKRRGLKIALIALAVLLVLAAGGLAFAGNYLFRFALDPQGGGMLSAHDLDNLELEGEYAWFAGHSEDRWLTSHILSSCCRIKSSTATSVSAKFSWMSSGTMTPRTAPDSPVP